MKIKNHPDLKLGSNLRKLMKQRGLTFAALAADTGIPKTTIFNCAQNTVVQSKRFYLLKRLADYFGITLDELMFGKIKIEKDDRRINNGDTIVGTFRVIKIEKIKRSNE